MLRLKLKRFLAAGGGAPAGLVDEVPVEDGGVILVEAPVDGVLAVREGVQVRLVHLAALPVGVEVILASGGGRPVDVPVDGQPVILLACRHASAQAQGLEILSGWGRYIIARVMLRVPQGAARCRLSA